MIKNIIFDLGNVLMGFNPKPYFSEFLKDEALSNRLIDLITNDPSWNYYDQGLLTLDEVKQNYIKIFPKDEDSINLMLDHWMGVLKPIKPMIKLFYELKERGFNCFILSNLSKDAADHIKANYSLIQDADGYVLSYEEKLVKPDPAIYQCLLSRYNLVAEECLFLDDVLKNTTAALSLGINTIHVASIDQAIEAIKEQLYD